MASHRLALLRSLRAAAAPSRPSRLLLRAPGLADRPVALRQRSVATLAPRERQQQQQREQQPRRGFAAAAAGSHATNPIKAKIKGTLVEARDKGVPVEVGMEVELEHTFGPADVQTFAGLSGDDNPIHLDHDYATKHGIFKGAIVHGLLVGSLFGTIFGVTFPGCVYLSQSFKFSRPIYVGKPVTAVVEVTRRREREESSPPSSILFCATHVIDEDGVTAIAGEAVVMLVHKDKANE